MPRTCCESFRREHGGPPRHRSVLGTRPGFLAESSPASRVGPAPTARPGGGDSGRGAEPVPGYRLLAPLGRGGFGEVWKAEGPGGFPVALKFVRLDRQLGRRAERRPGRPQGIRHPHLLATFGAWQVGDPLIIAMELADRTLGDRLRRGRGRGLRRHPRPGAPRVLPRGGQGDRLPQRAPARPRRRVRRPAPAPRHQARRTSCWSAAASRSPTSAWSGCWSRARPATPAA